MSPVETKKLCTYCNSIADTRDHIPPKCMFPKPLPASLITVPCCKSCNSSFCKDDEYARDVITFREELSDNPLVMQLNKTVSKRFARTETQRYFDNMYTSFGEETLYTNNGIYLETKITFDYDRSRVENVLKRTVRGLYRHIRNGIKLSDEFDVQVYRHEDLLSLEDEYVSIFNILTNKKSNIIISNGFEYTYHSLSSKPKYTVWKLCFYSKYDEFAITCRQ
jgi:hypothetical protein